MYVLTSAIARPCVVMDRRLKLPRIPNFCPHPNELNSIMTNVYNSVFGVVFVKVQTYTACVSGKWWKIGSDTAAIGTLHLWAIHWHFWYCRNLKNFFWILTSCELNHFQWLRPSFLIIIHEHPWNYHNDNYPNAIQDIGDCVPKAPSPFVVELVAEDPTWHIFADDV